MSAARPSKASVANVLLAIVAAGLRPGPVRIAPDGSFVVETISQEDIHKDEITPHGEPRRFGEQR